MIVSGTNDCTQIRGGDIYNISSPRVVVAQCATTAYNRVRTNEPILPSMKRDRIIRPNNVSYALAAPLPLKTTRPAIDISSNFKVGTGSGSIPKYGSALSESSIEVFYFSIVENLTMATKALGLTRCDCKSEVNFVNIVNGIYD